MNIGDEDRVVVDRVLGSEHPNYKNMIYPINYGYVKGIVATDDEEQDAYIMEVNKPINFFKGVIIAIITRKDDIEEKWVVAPKNAVFTIQEIAEATYFTE